MKTLFYLDAENVSVGEAKEAIAIAKRGVQEGDQFYGKFYGSLVNCKGVVEACYEEGLEFVETSSLLTGKKNVADMKLMLDCVFDVFVTWNGEVRGVTVVTKDQDFTPLFYKLKGAGVSVDAPLAQPAQRHLTVGDVTAKLTELGYDPLGQGVSAFRNQWSKLRTLLPAEFDDELLGQFLEKKRNKFVRAITPFCDVTVVERLRAVPASVFDFYTLLAQNKWSLDEKVRLARCYTSKYYGLQFSEKELVEMLSRRDG